jgi:hypothetical protein
MAGLWGDKDTTTRAERKAAKDNAIKQMREQKNKREQAAGSDHRRARRASVDEPRPKGSLGW